MYKRRRIDEAFVADPEIEDYEEGDPNEVLHPDFVDALKKRSIEKLTPVQRVTIPIFRRRPDMVIRAKAGSGKTLACLISLLDNHFCTYPDLRRHIPLEVIILLPTIQLCTKVWEELTCLIDAYWPCNRKVALLTSVTHSESLDGLKNGMFHILVSTPCCVKACIKEGFLQQRINFPVHAHTIPPSVSTLVIDKIDQYSPRDCEALKSIIPHLPEFSRCLLTTDDQSYDVQKLMDFFKWNPYVVTLTEEGGVSVEVIPYNVKQFYILCHNPRDKLLRMLSFLKHHRAKILIFTNSTERSSMLARIMSWCSFVPAIFNPGSRDNCGALEHFYDGFLDCLIVTDDNQTAQNLNLDLDIDFNKVEMVVNYDLPPTFDAYVRRVTCTGSADRIGSCYSLVVSEAEERIFEEIRSSFGEHGSKVIRPYPPSYLDTGEYSGKLRRGERELEIDVLLGRVPQT